MLICNKTTLVLCIKLLIVQRQIENAKLLGWTICFVNCVSVILLRKLRVTKLSNNKAFVTLNKGLILSNI